MFKVTVVFGGNSTAWSFLFNTDLAAHVAATGVASGTDQALEYFTIKDDFSQECMIKNSDIEAILVEDIDKAAEAQIAAHIHQLRTNAKAYETANKDPLLRQIQQLQQMQQGPKQFIHGGGGAMARG